MRKEVELRGRDAVFGTDAIEDEIGMGEGGDGLVVIEGRGEEGEAVQIVACCGDMNRDVVERAGDVGLVLGVTEGGDDV